MSKVTTSVVQDPTNPISDIILARSIVNISDSMAKLMASGLNRKAIVALIHDDTKEYKSSIERVLGSLKNLAATYTGE